MYTSFINGGFAKASNLIKPMRHHGQPASLALLDATLMEDAIRSTRLAYAENPDWVDNASRRSKALREISEKMSRKREDLAFMDASNTGKLLSDALGEVDLCVDIFRYYAELTENFSFRESEVCGNHRVTHEKRGIPVTGLITPWNFPLLQSSVKVAGGLAAGGGLVLKPSLVAPFSSIALSEIAHSVGVPAGMLNCVLAEGKTTGAVFPPHVDRISFTGGYEAAKKICQAAADYVVPVSLELGGKGCLVICEDADLELAVNETCDGIYRSAGQVCSATSRVIVSDSIAPTFFDLLVQKIQGWRVGGPFSKNSDMGPVVGKAEQRKIISLIQESYTDSRLQLLAGSSTQELQAALESEDTFVQPHLFSIPKDEVLKHSRSSAYSNRIDVLRLNCPMWAQEVFGPVLIGTTFGSMDELSVLINGTDYGLGNGVVTSSLETAEKVRNMTAGGVFWHNCNQLTPAAMEFGGVKMSGFSREFGRAGLEEYLWTKSSLENL